jgi:hypothetical protein
MKVGDLVRIKTGSGVFEDGEDTTCYWPESKGQIALLIAKTTRFYIPAAKVLVLGEVVAIALFDIEELEIV